MIIIVTCAFVCDIILNVETGDIMNFLNYQGNKNKLIDYINTYLRNYLKENKAFLDIFCGGCSICQYYYNKSSLFANDIETYSYHIANAIFDSDKCVFDEEWYKNFKFFYEENNCWLKKIYENELQKEKDYIFRNNPDDLINLYDSIPTLWNGLYSKIVDDYLSWDNIKMNDHFFLMTILYSTSYFGLLQAIELDSIRFAIEKTSIKYNKSYLLASLYSAMNTCVFSKDGHMAQPLNMSKNRNRLLKCRRISIFETFINNVKEYKYVEPKYLNKAFNLELNDLLRYDELFDEIGCVYADPPYTDMQYSRYYHLLNTITDYKLCNPTIKNGKYTAGLYLENRKQSDLSTKKNCLKSMVRLMQKCKLHNCNLVVSFAYPSSTSTEKKDRYVMNVDDLINECKIVFGNDNVEVHKIDYLHSNHRNSVKKKVLEYLICCRG